jgi:G:T-mismatch repair DNA endonuclease (very short patch repair protein)
MMLMMLMITTEVVVVAVNYEHDGSRHGCHWDNHCCCKGKEPQLVRLVVKGFGKT